jgi:hypothetical protein
MTSTPPNIPTAGDDAQAGTPVSREPDRPIAPEPIQTQSGTPTSQNQGEMSLVKKAQIDLYLAEEAKESIDPSETWEAVVGRIKWLMDVLSPVVEVRAIFVSFSFHD